MSRHAPDTGRFRSLVAAYRASDDYKKLADTTKRNWGRCLDRIADYFGDLRIAQLDRPDKIRTVILRWRNQRADKPRTADYGMQVLSRVLSYAVDPLGKVASNPCEGSKHLYTCNRYEIVWTDAASPSSRRPDFAQVKMTSRARQRSPTPLTLQLIRGCVSETCCAFPGRTSAMTRSL